MRTPTLLVLLIVATQCGQLAADQQRKYPVVGTGQEKCFDASGKVIHPSAGETFFGQDAQSASVGFSFRDNNDGTITDRATGLMWAQADSGIGIDWEQALKYAADAELAGYSDWRLPNVKELQSIVDYSLAPNASKPDQRGPAIDTSFFEITALPPGSTEVDPDYGYVWTSTSAYHSERSPEYCYAWYVAFGSAPDREGNDMHGAGGVRFDTKVEGNQLSRGDAERVRNFVRLVRNVQTSAAKQARLQQDTAQ